MPDVPAAAVAAALAKRADLLSDRPDPTVLSEETLTRLMLEAAAPILAEAWGVAGQERFREQMREMNQNLLSAAAEYYRLAYPGPEVPRG